MNVLETDWWTLALPPEWWADAEEEGILIGDRDDVGCIEISTLQRDDADFSEADLQAIARDELPQVAQWRQTQCGEFEGMRGEFREEGSAIRSWLLMAGRLMLFATYSCDEDNAGMDDAAVDEILDTLMLKSEG